MIRVYVDIVGDLFHAGHVSFLRQASELGDVLVVGVHSDDAVETYKRRPVLTMEERIAVIASCRYVQEVIPDAPLVVGRDYLREHRIDLVVHGDDMWHSDALQRFYAEPQQLGILRLVPYTTGISTSDIIARIENRNRISAVAIYPVGTESEQVRADLPAGHVSGSGELALRS
jgi:cytidyltransferase-like protein